MAEIVTFHIKVYNFLNVSSIKIPFGPLMRDPPKTLFTKWHVDTLCMLAPPTCQSGSHVCACSFLTVCLIFKIQI